jgi:hypothetical protein
MTQAGGTLTDRAAIAWALPVLYRHELVHHIVEDIVSALEFRSEDYSIFQRAQSRWSGFILMEEAIANSLAFSVQSKFLDSTATRGTFEAERQHQAQYDKRSFVQDEEPSIDPNLMLKAISDVFRSQPVGYRDFIDLGSDWMPLLAKNLRTLIWLLYLNDDPPGIHRKSWHHHRIELDEVFVAFENCSGPDLRRWHHDGTVHWGQPNG